MRFMDKVRARLPSREAIAGNRWLSWLAPWLHHTKLWHWSRRGVAMGVSKRLSTDQAHRGACSGDDCA